MVDLAGIITEGECSKGRTLPPHNLEILALPLREVDCIQSTARHLIPPARESNPHDGQRQNNLRSSVRRLPVRSNREFHPQVDEHL